VFLDWFLTSAGKFERNNDPAKPKCVPMLQGTSEGAVWQIFQQGFGVVATTDDGFYGRVYFTSKLSYATNYVQQSGGDGKVFLLEGDGQFDGPSSVVCNLRGEIVVVDANNNRIQVFDRNGVLV